MTQITRTVPRARYRRIPQRGGFSASDYNDTVQEVIADLNEFHSIWNNKIYTAFLSLPRGTYGDHPSAGIDALATGISGQTVWTYPTATLDDGSLFWDTTNSRKRTIYESFLALDARVEDVKEYVQSALNSFSASALNLTPLTTATARNLSYIQQLALDTMGSSYAFTGTGAQTFNYPLATYVKALLNMHNGTTYLTEISSLASIVLSHSYNSSEIVWDQRVAQTNVDKSLDYTTRNRTASVSHLQDDLNRIRWEIAKTRGIANWQADILPAYLGGPVDLQTHINATGTGIQNAFNPHGTRMANLTDGTVIINAIAAFTGMTSWVDNAPTYTSTHYLTSGDDLELSISKLDAAFEDLVAHETIHPECVGAGLSGAWTPPAAYGILGGLGVVYTTSGATWSQAACTWIIPVAANVFLPFKCTIPVTQSGLKPTSCSIYANVIADTTADQLATLQLDILEYGGVDGPCTDGVDLDCGNGTNLVNIVQNGWVGDQMEVKNFGKFSLSGVNSGQLNFIIKRLLAGDTLNQKIYLLSVCIDWYGLA